MSFRGNKAGMVVLVVVLKKDAPIRVHPAAPGAAKGIRISRMAFEGLEVRLAERVTRMMKHEQPKQ